MNIILESSLKNQILKLNRFIKENSDFKAFFNESNNIIDKTLQDLSFDSNIEFLDEISFIFSVISSIITRPHILSKGEEIVIRSELAPNLSTGMFQKTIRDSQLWTQDGIDMIPEYVYYYQHIDELRIYENIFIIVLIKKIEAEIIRYNEFYGSLIEAFDDQEALSLDKDNADIALKKLQSLNRRLKHIKHTFFYKEVSKGIKNNFQVHPTNILVKDRLYNYCYKFYKKLLTYNDNEERLYDIRLFYYVGLLKSLKNEGFRLQNAKSFEIIDGKIIIPTAIFENDDFSLSFIPNDELIGLELIVQNKKIKDDNANKAKHLLLFDAETKFKDNKYTPNDEYDSIDVLSLWNMAHIYDSLEIAYNNIYKEDELISKWLKSKIKNTIASYDIYTSFCAICKKQALDINENNVITCEACNSKYIFTKNKENSNECIWFIKIRR